MKILLVEDQDDVRYAFIEGLKTIDSKYDFVESYDGEDCLSKLDDEFDIIIIDVMMPNMDGIQLASRIRRIKRYQEVPIVFVSAVIDDDVRENALKYGNMFVEKPIDFIELDKKIKEM